MSVGGGCECAMVDRRIPKCVTDPVTKATDTSTTWDISKSTRVGAGVRARRTEEEKWLMQ
jgi:hypothetical protein